MQDGSQIEHEWLRQLVGEWQVKSDASAEPGSSEHTGSESVRSLGGMWIVCDGRGEMPDGTPAMTMMSLGYDPVKGRYVGTFVGSMMSHLWIYEGELDATGKTLVLDTEGPGFVDSSRMAKYQDRIEFVSADHRLLTSAYLDDGGVWQEFMRAHYRRAS